MLGIEKTYAPEILGLAGAILNESMKKMVIANIFTMPFSNIKKNFILETINITGYMLNVCSILERILSTSKTMQ